MNSLHRALEFHDAVKNNDTPKVNSLLSQGVDVNIKLYKSSPLHAAAISNQGNSHFKVAEILLKKGADINALDQCRGTPFYNLFQNGNVKFLNCF